MIMKKMKTWKLLILMFMSITSFVMSITTNYPSLKIYFDFGTIIPNYILMVYGFQRLALKIKVDKSKK